ncbi:MAG: ribonuclease H-like domain-containing protein [bacterium]
MKEIKFYFDLETEPALVRTWRKWKQNVVWKERDGYVWSFSGCFNDGKIFHYNLTDFSEYKKDKFSEKALAKKLWECFNKADIVIAHNGNAFDIGRANALFAKYDLGVPSPYKKVDTLLIARKNFDFFSNSLNDLAEYLGIGLKAETGGYSLWKGCENEDKKSIRTMGIYNNQDVWLLREVYKKLLPFIPNHPNIGIIIGERSVCPSCGSKHLQSRGIRYGKRSWFCVDCRSWHSSALKDNSQIR